MRKYKVLIGFAFLVFAIAMTPFVYALQVWEDNCTGNQGTLWDNGSGYTYSGGELHITNANTLLLSEPFFTNYNHFTVSAWVRADGPSGKPWDTAYLYSFYYVHVFVMPFPSSEWVVGCSYALIHTDGNVELTGIYQVYIDGFPGTPTKDIYTVSTSLRPTDFHYMTIVVGANGNRNEAQLWIDGVLYIDKTDGILSPLGYMYEIGISRQPNTAGADFSNILYDGYS